MRLAAAADAPLAHVTEPVALQTRTAGEAAAATEAARGSSRQSRRENKRQGKEKQASQRLASPTVDAKAERSGRAARSRQPQTAQAAAPPPQAPPSAAGWQQTGRDALAGALLATAATNAWFLRNRGETAEEKTRRALRDAKERAALAEAAAVVPRGDVLYSAGSAGEPVEWVNMWFKKVWKIYQRSFERFLVRVLQPPIDNLQKPGYIKRVLISEFTLGNDPIVFSNMRRRTSRQVNDMQYEVDCRYSGNARALINVELGAGSGSGGTNITVPVLLYNLDFDGELWVQVRMGPMSPWVDTVSVSFASLPNIRFELAPFGQVKLMDIPILNSFLEQLLMRDLPSLILYPRRIDFTLASEEAVAAAAAMAAEAAPEPMDAGPACAIAPVAPTYKGELVVTLVEARELPVLGLGATSNPFCTLSLGTQLVESRTTKQTALTAQRGAPAWEQEFVFLVEDPQRQRLLVQCRDSYFTLRPYLGFCQLSIADLKPGSQVDVWLPLAYDNNQLTRGEIRLVATYSSFTDRPMPRTGPGQAAAAAARATEATGASSTKGPSSDGAGGEDVARDLASLGMPADPSGEYQGPSGLVNGWLEDVDGARQLLQPTDDGTWRGGNVEMVAAMPNLEETLPLLEQWWSGVGEEGGGGEKASSRSGESATAASGSSKLAEVGGFAVAADSDESGGIWDQDAAMEEALALEALAATSLKQAAKSEQLQEKISAAPISEWSTVWQDALEGDAAVRGGADAPRPRWRRAIRTARGFAVGVAVGVVCLTMTYFVFRTVSGDQEELQRRAFELYDLERSDREVALDSELDMRRAARGEKERELGRVVLDKNNQAPLEM